MKIPRENCPPDFFVRADDFKSVLFIAEIVKWDIVGFALGNFFGLRERGVGSLMKKQLLWSQSYEFVIYNYK
jgi:hypothetical protein